MAHGVPILDDDFRVCAAGKGDDGGVEGVNRMLVTWSQLAAADRDRNGRQRYRFVGLLDNDPAGRIGLSRLTTFTSRLQEFRDIFLLFPTMPILDSRGMPYIQDSFRQLSKSVGDSRFEIEDLVSPKLLRRFEQLYPSEVRKREPFGTRLHYHFTGPGKSKFKVFVLENGSVEDFCDFFVVIKALRSYLGLDHSKIRVQ